MIKKGKKDKSIKSCKINIPDFKTLNDFKLTIEKSDQDNGNSVLTFTKCDSIRLIPLHKGADNDSISRANSNKPTSKKSDVSVKDSTTPVAPLPQITPVNSIQNIDNDNQGSK